ncbi:unnamed protein product [Rodentolepis nana]|uniref:ATP-dependent DNA helicase n=1 Tax=Rodentolepis nana TaxID=102285 RepID=A0A158QIY3_RODNA|nr:unnamed protein product [Rodentolepis nana]
MSTDLSGLAIRESQLKVELSSINGRIESLIQQREIVKAEYEQVKHQLAVARLKSSETSGVCTEYTDQLFPWTAELNRVRLELFHIVEFRPLQLPAINAFLDGRDVILVMPTGAGKSLVYQLPSYLETPEHQGTFTLVISPLVSLMTDQAIGLRRLGIPESSVVVLDGSSSPSDQQKILVSISGDDKNKKLSKSKRLMNRLEKAYAKGRLGRIAVDEVHCVSQWGHDFRPDYKFLHVLRTQFPQVPILGLTATASTEVVLDVQKMLGLQQQRCLVLRSSYNRPNLRYKVRFQSSSITTSYSTICDLLKTEFRGQSGIVYCISQKDTESLAEYLNKESIGAAFYHANVDPCRRERDHIAWLDGKLQVIVATVAFGMGIDKPDVRFVIHLSPSKSVENYYQESGRAGRDGQPSQVILLWRLSDLFRLANMVFAEQTGLPKLNQMIGYVVETKRCRRQLIAEGLGYSDWRADHCEEFSCDICSRVDDSPGYEIDASDFVKRMFDVLDENRRRSQRLTGVKLVDLLVKDSGVADELSNRLSFHLNRRQHIRLCEYLLSWCLCHGVLTLDFHFTPYSTIAYVVAASVKGVDMKVRLPDDVLTGEETPKASRKRAPPTPTIELDSD